jgi:ribose transport system ATP-binding protein
LAVLSADRLTKSFFGNVVLRSVSIDIEAGSVHALLGENGAGKSTLINLLSGNLIPDSGSIRVGGVSYDALNPDLAHALGIAVVHQELSLAPHLSAAENVGLGNLPRRAGLIDYRRLDSDVTEVFAKLELDVPLTTPVHRLPLGTQQLLEIAKALYRRPRVLVLDEPTSFLTAVEVARFKRIIRQLRDQGIALVFISHRLNEVLDICDTVTVLKDGQVTASRRLDKVEAAELVRLMVGRDPGDLFPPWRPSSDDRNLLEVEDLQSRRLTGVNLTLKRGEILGVGGLLGQGQEDLLLALAGSERHRARRIAVCGAETRLRNVMAANSLGIAYVPSDRKGQGLHLPQSLNFNLTLPGARRLARFGVRRRSLEQRVAGDLIERFSIRGVQPSGRVLHLSGGNQQKIAMAKWMPLEPRILLLNDPTRGVDVETKREVYLFLRHRAAQGTGVILLSSDTLELVNLCDRVMVMSDGRVRNVVPRERLSEHIIVSSSLGIPQPGAKDAVLAGEPT